MSNYNSLKTTIDANIKQNGRQEITGQILNSVLNQMVTTLGAGYQFAGVATLDPATDPGTPDAKVFYIANGKGTYTNFGGVEVTEDDVVVLYWDSSWHKVSTGIASNEKLSELEDNLNITESTDITNSGKMKYQYASILENGKVTGIGNMSAYLFPVEEGCVYDITAQSYIDAGSSSRMYAFYTNTEITDANNCVGYSDKYIPGPDVVTYKYNNVSVPLGAKYLVVVDSGLLNVIKKKITDIKSVAEALLPFARNMHTPFEQIINKPSSCKRLYVKKDGTGDFTTIQDAINSINDASIINQYEIRVCDDFSITELTDLYLISSPSTKNTQVNPTAPCAYIVTKDYVHIVGDNRMRKISVHSPYNLAASSFQYVQVMFLQGNVRIENLEFELKNGRYAVHQEGSGLLDSPDNNAITIMKNCKCIHLGNSDSAAGESAWPSICGQANGTCSGLECIFENVEWTPFFYIHNAKNFDVPTYFKFKNCTVIANKDELNTYQGVYINTSGIGQNFDINIEGCNFLGLDYAIETGSDNTLSNPAHDVRTMIPVYTGCGNYPMLVPRIIYSQLALCFESVSNNVNVDVIGGTAKDAIFGETLLKFNGQTNAKGCTVGTEYIKDGAFTLGKRLGDCSTTNKNLLLSVGGDTITINFTQNYTQMSNDDIITAINNQISSLGVTAVNVSKDSTMVMYPFKDRYEIGFNYGNTAILAGSAVKRDINNFLGWVVCQNGDKADGMAGERIEPNGNGKILSLKDNIFKSLRDYSIGNSKYIKAYNDGTWTDTDSLADADMVMIAVGSYKGI